MTLYHYCSAATFESIIRSKSIWLSSLSQSNDTHEGIWMDRLLRQICLENDFSPSEIDSVSEIFRDSVSYWDVLGFCLTPNEDMLSQWRGYADDGCGFAIGFNEDRLKSINGDDGELIEVVYEMEEQLHIVRDRVQPILDIMRKGLRAPKPAVNGEMSKKERFRRIFQGPKAKLRTSIGSLNDTMYRLKNYAFHEERETRLITRVTSQYPDCEFHRSGRRLVPHRTMKFSNEDPSPVIEKVILGPSNPTPPNIVEAFLRENGFEDAEIISSAATYRARV